MTAGRWKVYEKAKLHTNDGTGFNLGGGTIKMALFQSTSNANTLSGSDRLADLTNEVAAGFGYSTGGVVVAGNTWVNAAGVETFTSGSGIWVAAGGSIVGRYAVVYILGTVGGIVNPIICVSLLDTTNADVTVPDGQQFQIAINAAGIFTLSGATAD